MQLNERTNTVHLDYNRVQSPRHLFKEPPKMQSRIRRTFRPNIYLSPSLHTNLYGTAERWYRIARPMSISLYPVLGR